MEPLAPIVNWGTTSWHSFPRTTLREKLDTWYAQHALLRLQTFYPSASDAMERLSAGGRKKQRKMRALPLECLKERGMKAEMVKMLMTMTSRWRMRTRRRLTDWESKKNTEEAPDDDIDMTDARSSHENVRPEEERRRNVPDQKVVFSDNTKEQQEEEDEKVAKEQDQDEERREARMRLPMWTTRIIQASLIQCIDIAQNEDAIDSTARAMDCMILSYLKDRYRLFHLWTSVAPAQQYHDHVTRLKLIPEFDGYIPYVGETADGELKEPTEAQLIASFHANAKNGKIGGRELETYLKGVNGIRVLCKIMRYLVQIGITPQLIFSKVADNTDEDDERQSEARRESSDFVRKIISGAFAVRSYDYFRVTPPRRDDHVHIDPVELACAVTERCRTFTILVTLNKIGLELPQQLRKVWQGKLKAVQQSAAQMATCLRSLDPAEREIARQYVRALGDEQPAEEQASASTKETDNSKKRRKRWTSLDLCQWRDLMRGFWVPG